MFVGIFNSLHYYCFLFCMFCLQNVIIIESSGEQYHTDLRTTIIANIKGFNILSIGVYRLKKVKYIKKNFNTINKTPMYRIKIQYIL